MTNWKSIGKVGSAQGLSGSFFLVGNRDHDPSGEDLVIGEDPSCGIPVYLDTKKYVQGQWVLKLRGIEDRKALEDIRGQALWIDAGEDISNPLVGLEVVDRNNFKIGKVVEVTNHGASDIVVIENEANKFVDLPLIADFFILPPTDFLKLQIPQSDFEDLWY